MLNITSRSISRKTGSEGPRHDPYSYTELTMEVNGVEATLHCGLGVFLDINGQHVSIPDDITKYEDREAWLIKKFEEFCGMSVADVEEAYWRIHPYFEDPMGSPSMYI